MLTRKNLTLVSQSKSRITAQKLCQKTDYNIKIKEIKNKMSSTTTLVKEADYDIKIEKRLGIKQITYYQFNYYSWF